MFYTWSGVPLFYLQPFNRTALKVAKGPESWKKEGQYERTEKLGLGFHLMQPMDCLNFHGIHVNDLTSVFWDIIISSFLCQLSKELLIFISRPHFANFHSAQPNSDTINRV